MHVMTFRIWLDRDLASVQLQLRNLVQDMRQRPKPHNNKRISITKSRLSALAGASSRTTRRKRPKIPYSRQATCHSRLNHHFISLRRPKKRVRERVVGLARIMAELRIPFLPAVRRQRSETEVINQLRCVVNRALPLQELQWKDSHLVQEFNGIPHECHANDGVHWNLPARRSLTQGIRTHAFHLDEVWRRLPSLQIPAYWPVFTSVDWTKRPLFELGTTDSSESCIRTRPAYTESDFDEYTDASIKCLSKTPHDARTRGMLVLLNSMDPDVFRWNPQTRERANRREARRHAGLVDRNQASINQDLWPQTAMSALLYTQNELPPPDPDMEFSSYLSEMDRAMDVGRLISYIVATDAFPCENLESLYWPLHLSLGSQSPAIDYTCRAKHSYLGRNKKVYPLLFAAQCRTETSAERDTVHRLGIAFQPMMTLFTLYYLDTRKDQDEPLPDWMFLFGAVYDRGGWSLWAFHPSFRPRTLNNVDTLGWGTDVKGMKHRGTLDGHPRFRGPSIQALYRIQGHCSHVLERLLCWDGYERTCKRLSVRQ